MKTLTPNSFCLSGLLKKRERSDLSFIFNYLETNHTDRDLLLHVPAWSYFFYIRDINP